MSENKNWYLSTVFYLLPMEGGQKVDQMKCHQTDHKQNIVLACLCFGDFPS